MLKAESQKCKVCGGTGSVPGEQKCRDTYYGLEDSYDVCRECNGTGIEGGEYTEAQLELARNSLDGIILSIVLLVVFAVSGYVLYVVWTIINRQ